MTDVERWDEKAAVLEAARKGCSRMSDGMFLACVLKATTGDTEHRQPLAEIPTAAEVPQELTDLWVYAAFAEHLGQCNGATAYILQLCAVVAWETWASDPLVNPGARRNELHVPAVWGNLAGALMELQASLPETVGFAVNGIKRADGSVELKSISVTTTPANEHVGLVRDGGPAALEPVR